MKTIIKTAALLTSALLVGAILKLATEDDAPSINHASAEIHVVGPSSSTKNMVYTTYVVTGGGGGSSSSVISYYPESGNGGAHPSGIIVKGPK